MLKIMHFIPHADNPFNSNSIFPLTDVANNGKPMPMNASLSEDSVAETALAKKNSDGKWTILSASPNVNDLKVIGILLVDLE